MTKDTISLILIIAAFLLVLVVFGVRPVLKVIRSMHPIETGEICDSLLVVKCRYVNFYLIKSENGYIAIDSGTSASEARKGLDSLGIKPDEIRAVFLTHSDIDHIGGLDLFPNAPLYFPEAEKVMIDGSTRRAIWGKNSFDKEFSSVKDKDVIRVDELEISCYETPGHTKGSMSYSWNKNFFTGDLAGISEKHLVLFPSLLSMDSDIQHLSLERIKTLQPERVLTAHHGMLEV